MDGLVLYILLKMRGNGGEYRRGKSHLLGPRGLEYSCDKNDGARCLSPGAIHQHRLKYLSAINGASGTRTRIDSPTGLEGGPRMGLTTRETWLQSMEDSATSIPVRVPTFSSYCQVAMSSQTQITRGLRLALYCVGDMAQILQTRTRIPCGRCVTSARIPTLTKAARTTHCKTSHLFETAIIRL